jgi:sortase A
VDALIQYLRRHRWARRSLSGASVLLLVAALGLLGYPFYTNLYQSRVQSHLTHQLASPELQQRYRNKSLQVGDSLTRIKIPKIGVDVVVVEGTSASALRAGAGHYPETPLPCEAGNVGIAGHRTTYGKPFANIDRLNTGDTIILDTPVGSCTYQIEKVAAGRTAAGGDSNAAFVVLPNDRSVVADTPGKSSLTLTSCHPKGSARQRIVIRATLVGKGATSA